MEITVLRGSLSLSSLGDGRWSRRGVAHNLCRTKLSFAEIQKSRVQRRRPSQIVRGPIAASARFWIQSYRPEGTRRRNDMAVFMRPTCFSSFRCQRFDKIQEFSYGLGNKFERGKCYVSSRGAAAARFQSFSSGPVLFTLASRFHTAAVQEGRYICESDGDNGAAQCQSVHGSEASTVRAIHKGDVVRGANSGVQSGGECESRIEHWVVNFYHFVSIDDPHLEVARHAEFLKNHDVRGRIYISEQGINAQLSSRGKSAMDYAEWVKMDPRFSDLLVQTAPSPEGHAFPRLRLRYKASLVQVEGGTKHLPVTDPTARAVPLAPAEWTKMLDEAKLVERTKNVAPQVDSQEVDERSGNGNLSPSSARQIVLLDVRNGYEWDVGHFKGAQRPNVDCFKSTAFGLAEEEDIGDDPLADVDKEKVDVMMYCTGGIRCDVYSTMLRAKGFKNLYSLKGGISNYLKEEGAKKWAGNLFVFDSRLAVPPEVYHSKSTQEGGVNEDTLYETPVNPTTEGTFARCRLCGDLLFNPRHRNCANVDCNQLYLTCAECLPQFKGCCSQDCSLATKLRPLISTQQYGRWHTYRPTEPVLPKPADYVSRRAMKRRRRKERRKQVAMERASEEQESEQLVQNA